MKVALYLWAQTEMEDTAAKLPYAVPQVTHKTPSSIAWFLSQNYVKLILET